LGTTIVLEGDATEPQLAAGDHGVVKTITLDGVEVERERGFSLSIDPDQVPYRAYEPAQEP